MPATPAKRARFRLPPIKRPTWRELRNIIIGTLLVVGGLGTALLTVVANRAGYPDLVSVASAVSLLFVLLIVVFVIPPLLRSARTELKWLDFGISVTKGGLIFTGLLLIVGFAAWNTGNNLLFLVFSLLASTVFVGFTAARASLRDLIVSARFPDHLFAGEPSPVIVTVRNKKNLLPSFSVQVEARSKEGEGEKRGAKSQPSFLQSALAYFAYVPHRAAVEQRVEHLFPRRGHLLVTGFDLFTSFPFGFIRHRRRLRARNVDIIVYPKPEPIDDALHLLPMNAGRIAAARPGAGYDLLRLRDYQPQDDLRRMDWKATARTGGRLIVREFMAEDERRVHVALDTTHPPAADPSDFAGRFEKGVTLAASLVAHFIRENAEVRLTLGAESGNFGSGPDHLYHCLKRLALVESRPEPGPQQFTGFLESLPAVNGHYVILLTTAAPGTIPAPLWRRSHVIYL